MKETVMVSVRERRATLKLRLETLEQLATTLSVEEIAELGDDTLRNYLITYSYHLLDAQMRPYVGSNLSWVGFASWASALAGGCIRGETIPLGRFAPPRFIDSISRAVARGNQWVYGDIAPVFRDFIAFMGDASERERAAVARRADGGGRGVYDSIREALRLDPRPHSEGGQALLCAAFEQYFLAARESDPDTRAERVFVANAAVGVHEQRHLDPMIDKMLGLTTLNAATRAMLGPIFFLADATRPLRDRVPNLSETKILRRVVEVWPGAAAPLKRASDVTRKGRDLARQIRDNRFSYAFGTRFVLALPLGDETIPLGEDIKPLDGGEMFPAHLKTLDTRDPRFRALLEDVLVWDRTPDTPDGTAAGDWSDLGHRMNFIVDLFRSRQQEPKLFRNPLAERPS